ncbi:MAG: DUF4838 domain-containing protein [Victivallales bacterium]|nr:DUF4838 domain-containing protein [Victivallales bacterium]
MRFYLFLIVSMLMPVIGIAADAELNLLCEGTFKPVIMHGRPSAAYGWTWRDYARRDYISKNGHKYLSGDGCFNLDFKNGAMTVSFPDPLHPAYVNKRVAFYSRISNPNPPAPEYLFSGKAKFDRGKLVLGKSLSVNGKILKAQAGWRFFEFKTKKPFSQFTVYPEAGASFSVADFKCLALYPRIGGAIKLPNGGELTRLLLPRNASYLMRWSIALWRGWLWKITGTALPVEIVDEVKPAAGAFAAVKGKTAPGGWELQVNSNGIVLTYGEELVIAPALFDFLRGLGYAYYARDCVVELKSDPQRVLPLTDRQAKPRFHYYYSEYGAARMNGGIDSINMLIRNDADWFHLPDPGVGHVLNVILPVEMYKKSHPEYYMMDKHGKRVINDCIGLINPCLSNPDAMRICTENLIDYVLKQLPHYPTMVFWIGDVSGHCLCPECVKINHGMDSYSDLLMMHANKVAAGIAKERPNTKFAYSPYASWHKPPVTVKPAKNVTCLYALTHHVMPCTLHVDCELNRAAYEELAQWRDLMGGREKVGVVTYRDMRPLHNISQMEFVNKFASRDLFNFYWKGPSPAIPFVTARWNLGEDPDKLVKEFNDHYYGKGGKFITEIDYFVEDFAAAYKHTPEELKNAKNAIHQHICIRGDDLHSCTVLDRETFDKLYVLFDRALAAVGNTDKIARRHILTKKASYMLEDLNKYRRNSCSNDKELAGFVKRLIEFIKTAREVPTLCVNTFRAVPGRTFLTAVAGLQVPDTGKPWFYEPMLEKLITDPDPTREFLLNPKAIPGGWYFKPRIFKGGSGAEQYSYQCSPKISSAIRRATCGQDKISIVFKLSDAVSEPAMLILEGLDDDKQGRSKLQVKVNGKVLFSGPNNFPENDWGKMTLGIPGGILHLGENRIELSNITPDMPSHSARFTDPDKAKHDLQWGWMMFSGVYLMMPGDEFKRLVSGKKARGWRQNTIKRAKPLGIVEAKDGKLLLKGGQAEWTGILFAFAYRKSSVPKLAIQPGQKIRITVKASGKGQLFAGYWSYLKDDRPYSDAHKEFKLEAKPKVFTEILTLSSNKKIDYIVPTLQVKGQSQASVEDYRLEILPENE